MGRIVVTEFISVDGVVADRAVRRATCMAAGRSPSIAATQLLVANGLVDEYWLMVFPVLLGSGTRLFPAAEFDAPARLGIVSAERAGDVELLVLRPAG